MSEQIAKWHFAEWGKYSPELTEQAWINKSLHYPNAEKETIIATVDKQLVGSISLKKQWLSGLYVTPAFRGKKIGATLIKRLLELATDKTISDIYLFTHTLSLEGYYKKLGWELIQPLGEDYLYYKNHPILIFKGNVSKLSNILEKYLLEVTN